MQTAETHEWLTAQEIAEKYRLSKPTVYRLVAAGALRALQPGGPGSAIRIDASSLEARVRWARQDGEA
jgi:excisionase family DNA binding protein